MPHFSARRITSTTEFEDYLAAAVAEADVRRCFVIAGDPSEPEGPYFDSIALIASGAFERAGIRAIGIGGQLSNLRGTIIGMKMQLSRRPINTITGPLLSWGENEMDRISNFRNSNVILGAIKNI